MLGKNYLKFYIIFNNLKIKILYLKFNYFSNLNLIIMNNQFDEIVVGKSNNDYMIKMEEEYNKTKEEEMEEEKKEKKHNQNNQKQMQK